MKKIISILLLVCFTLSLAGCGDKNNEAMNNTSDISSGPGIIEIETYEANNNAADVFDGLFENNNITIDIEAFEPVKPAEIELDINDFKLNMDENIADADKSKIDSLDEEERNAIATKKANLVYELAVAFKEKGISVAINETSGELSLDSSVLFGGDSAALSQEGENLLNKFITAYSSVVFNDKFDGFVSKILVEGHTAPVSGSTYESGLPLSKERANKVKDYCVSKDTGLNETQISNLNNTLEAVGLSNSKPVKDSSGNVDMAASRRVTFRFLINID